MVQRLASLEFRVGLGLDFFGLFRVGFRIHFFRDLFGFVLGLASFGGFVWDSLRAWLLWVFCCGFRVDCFRVRQHSWRPSQSLAPTREVIANISFIGPRPTLHPFGFAVNFLLRPTLHRFGFYLTVLVA